MNSRTAYARRLRERRVVRAVVASLSPDLLKPRYRRKAKGKHKTFGHCYAASEAVYYLLGGKASGLQPQVMRYGRRGTHWFLRHKITGRRLDPTREQFEKPVDYEKGVRCPFLTGKPSKRASLIMKRARLRLRAA